MCNKIKQTCPGSKTYAPCVEYQLELPDYTTIESSCVTLEDTTEDLYKVVGEIKEDTDLSELGKKCLTYVEENGKKKVKNILLKYEEEICTLKEKVEELENGNHLCSQNLEGCGIDFGQLEDECGNPITTLGDALKAIVNQINNQ